MVENQLKSFYKIIMIGDTGTGKSCIVNRYGKDIFTPSGIATIDGILTSKKEIVYLKEKTEAV